MRISFVGIKGGIGKSTIALMVAKELSNRGFNVLFLDRDIFSFASNLAGIKNSFFTQVARGELPRDYFKDLGNLTIARLFGEGVLFFKEIEELHKDLVKKEIMEKSYAELVKRKKYDFFIIDNPPYVTMKSEVVEHELSMFRKIFPNEEIYRVYLSTGLLEDVEITKKYIDETEAEAPGKALGIIVNMVVDKEKGIEVLKSLYDNRFLVGVIIPFIDELFQFQGSIEDLPVIPQIKNFVDSILKMEKKIITY
ncbi:ParA family protein [Sulfurisphaera tokodaii]|uniref:CobQ/CobB/MinD/ParA nucleotide binding domain-containing protein n=2 Tax=Sulfurisphaera tokodaii TaxID=111955 RepID=Q973A7_SULTO|nr:ParA family protein [Sulfurisphaera tokodaii]BAB66006.1 hypothetical protein STK_09850 [Sulfurisphaera tokodaii str. 7]HII73970.1 ParA family protein [Sulfurisphaera tokodaii]